MDRDDKIIAVIALFFAAAFMVVLLVPDSPPTVGPFCPGMDPEWIGFCE